MFELEVSPRSRRSITAEKKIRKGENRKCKKTEKPKDVDL